MSHSLVELTQYYLGHAREAAASLAAMLAVCACFWAVGRLFTSESAVAILVGWASFYLLALTAAVAGITDLRIAMTIMVILALTSLSIRRVSIAGARMGGWPAAVLALPLLVLGAYGPPAYWDSYMHWLPNALYLYQLGHFPTVPLGSFPSAHPTYPMALPLVMYFASKLAGHFSEAAGPLTNVLCSLVAASFARQLLRNSLPARVAGPDDDRRMRVALTCVAFCAVILLNPAVQWIHYWSAIADPSLAVVVLIVIGKCCEFFSVERPRLDADRSGGTAAARGSLAILFMLGILLGGLKNSGLQAALVLAAAGILVGVRWRIAIRRWLPPISAVVLGTLAASILWGVYLSAQLPVPDQFSIHGLSAWRWDQLGHLARGIFQDVLGNWRYYGLLITAVVVGGGWALGRKVQPAGLQLMLGFATLAAIAHIAIVLVAYLGAGFADWEIARAASFQRYSTHVGFAVCVLALLLIALHLFVRYPSVFERRAILAAAIACLGCVYATVLLYPSLKLAGSTVRTITATRELADKALRLTAPAERTALIGQKWSILLAYYASWADISPQQRPVIVGRELACDRADLGRAEPQIRNWMENPGVDAIVLLDAQELAEGLGLHSAPDQIWRRADRRWRVVDLGRAHASCLGGKPTAASAPDSDTAARLDNLPGGSPAPPRRSASAELYD